MNKEFKKIYALVETLPVFSDHEHHADDDYFNGQPMTLERVMGMGYSAWAGYPIFGGHAEHDTLISNLRHNTSFIWLERGIQKVHGLKEPLTADNWDRVSAKVTKAYAADRNFHWKTLQKHGYERIVQDCFWNPGTNAGFPELFSPTFRIDKFTYGFHGESVASEDFHVWKRYGFKGGKLADFVELMRQTIRKQHKAGQVVALKCAEAYNRDINFLPDDEAAARKAFGVHPSRITPAQKTAFSNYIFNRACEIAAELDVPFQIHTGLARLAGSDPMRFEPIIQKYPNVRFVMFHSGYPWTDSAAGMAFTHRNVLPSLTWTATVSTTAAIRTLHEFLDVTKSCNHITWGSDTWVPEESVGALLAWRLIVATVISERLEMGLLHPKHVDSLAAKLMYENGRHIYM